MSTCREFTARVQPLAAGEIDGALALALGLHAAGCPDCDARLASTRRVHHELTEAARHPVEPPVDLVPRILSALPEERRPLPKRAWGAGIAAAALAGVGLAGTALVLAGGGLSGGPLLPELQAALSAFAAQLARFSALVETLAGLVPRLPAAGPRAGAGSGLLPGLALVATGLLGAVTALYLSATPRGLRPQRS